jgi:hypothetical protein
MLDKLVLDELALFDRAARASRREVLWPFGVS